MKKIGIALFALLILLPLAACGGDETPVDIDALAAELSSAGLFSDTLIEVDSSVVTDVMHLNVDGMESYKVFLGSGATAEEYAVFRCADADSAAALVTELEERVAAQTKTYSGYAPDAIPRLSNAVIKQKGSSVAYAIAEQYGDAAEIVEKYFG